MGNGRRERIRVGVAIALVAGAVAGFGSPVTASSAGSSQLQGVSCVSATSCVAVGFSSATTSGPDRTLAERWNGTAWSIVASPNPLGAGASRLAAVSCSAANACFAVGHQVVQASGAVKTLIEHWNGSAWSIVASPNPAGADSSRLAGVKCTSNTFCVAVGSQGVTSSGVVKTLVERWNGTKWSMVASPNPAGDRYPRLSAVSCTSTVRCVAVGDSLGPDGFLHTLVERWNGTSWSIIASPNPDAGEGGELLGVSCTTSANCMAVGDYLLGGAGRPATLVERWDGTRWSIVTSPVPERSYNTLQGVSCVSTRCMAAGYYNAYGPPPGYTFLGVKTLVERWNGDRMSIIASPNPAPAYNVLAAVSCTVASNCFAVGRFSTSTTGPFNTLVERWNGTAWTVVASP
jgi:hypothetical protein